MKVKYECSCCEQEYPSRKACLEHEEACLLAEGVADRFEGIAGKIDHENVDDVMMVFRGMLNDLRRIREYLKMHNDENFVINDKGV
jgi:hypothetical protein